MKVVSVNKTKEARLRWFTYVISNSTYVTIRRYEKLTMISVKRSRARKIGEK